MRNEDKLDNPVWHSLNDVHTKYSLDYEGIKFYNLSYCPFGGFIDKDFATSSISLHSKITDDFFVVGERPIVNNDINIKRELVCNQMLLTRQISIEQHEDIIHLKDENHRQDLFELVSQVQPGYFKNKTADLGRYFGIYKEGQLVAACGERMKMNEFTELSAIVTHPKYVRKGYAKQLIKFTTDYIFQENKFPYLHVLESNYSAIKLYEKLGFATRRKITFWKFWAN